MNSALPALYVIRHGNTDWADAGKHTGRTNIPLNAQGEARARQLGAELGKILFARVFTSPLLRAHKTCELSGLGSGAISDPDLMEWDYGKYEGLLTAEILRDNPGWELFRDGAPGGESPADIARRADRFVQKARQVQGNVAAFSSGHMIRTIAARWLGLEPRYGRVFFCTTASIGILGYEHSLGEPVMKLWNQQASLSAP
jgi:probable phosphoglycerate mutase